jgi:hypothetical protein
MKRIGTVRIVEGRFTIALDDAHAADLERCIYAFLVGDEILRIGSSKGRLKLRFHAWQADVSNAFGGDFRRTPKGEADIWRSALTAHAIGYLYSRPGIVATTPVGDFNLYQYEERALIARHRPRCCNDVKLLRNP